MCSDCSAEVKELARRIGTYTAAHNWSTPGLHIVLDDGNTEAHHIQWCIDRQQLDDEATWIAHALLKLNPCERHGVLSLAEDGSEIANGVPGFHALWEEDDDEG